MNFDKLKCILIVCIYIYMSIYGAIRACVQRRGIDFNSILPPVRGVHIQQSTPPSVAERNLYIFLIPFGFILNHTFI